ncbi:MAG: amino acid adenylation domain-containing protein, partial [Bacteroidota bacterium]
MEEATLVRFNLAEDFWIKRLKNLSVEKIKPFYPQSQITVDSSTKEVCFKLDDDISKRLLEISNGTDPSIFMLFLSSLSVLLRNYTGSNDICIATSGFINDPREEESSDTLIFLKGELTPDITVKELIDQHLKDLNQVYPHQNFDYESLLTKISDQGENKVGDLHHVGLIYSRFNRPSVFLEDLDLLFDFNLEEGSFLMNVVYKSDIYEITQINQLGRHYINLLKDSLYHSQKSISELSLFSNEDKNEIYSQVSELRNSGDYKKSVIELFEEKVVDFPNQIALVSGQEYITYYQLNKQANQLANFIRREYNVCKGDFIGVLARTTHSYILTILGILKSEAIFVPINPESPEEQNKNIIEQIRPKLIVTDSELMFTLANFYYGEMFALDIQLDQVRNSSEEVIPRTASSNNTIYTVFTSGTTGTPKGVMVQDHALANYALWLTNELSISQKDKSVLLSSISFDLGYTAVWGCLLGGATLHLIEDKIVKTPEYLTDYLVERAITFIKLTPSLFSMMNLADNVAMYEESSLRLVLLGGEKIKVEDIDSFKKYNSEIVFYNHYGPTESTIGCIAEKIAPMDFDAFERCPVIGKPIDNMSCYILNSELEPVPKGVIGELYIGGPGLAQGYLNQEELTNDKFKKSGIGHVEQRVYRSGDLARCLPNGKIEFLGRVDNQVKIDGYRVELGEIRSALNLFESIKDSYVVLKKRHNEPPILAAYVLKDDTEYDDLKEFLKTKLPVYKIPQVFISLAEFPLSPNGKIDTRALPDPSSQLSGRVKIKLPANDLERDIAEIWKEVLGKKEIGVEDNYFELGGNSLKGVIIVNKLKLLLNKFVPVTDLFEFPTIYELAQNIKQELEYKPNQLNKNGKSSSPEGLSGDALEFEIPNLEPSQYYPVSHSQKRLWIVSQFDGEKSAYNQPRVYLLEGELNIDALTRSFECLINRHEILRTSFVAQDGLPMQKIKDVDDVNFKIEFRDLSKEDNREQVLEEMIVGESKMPFNLENGPLMRVKVVKKSDKNHILFLTTHHIISDAWSMQIISKELITYYNQFITGDFNDPFSALKIQYKEYASWQKNLLGSDSGIKQKEYWLSRFQGDIPSLDLPLDFSRPKVRTTRGKTIRRKLSRKSCKGLKKIGTENNASLFMTVLATVNAFFYRYLEKDDISISAPVAGRDHSDLADQVGFYVNNLVIRTEFNGKEDSFMDILESVKVRTQEALRNQSYPYDLLVEELNLTRDLSRTPLYDVVLLVEKMDENAAEQMEGINISGYNTDHTVSWTDLRLSFIETGGEFNFIIDYNVDLFLPERIERMLNYYENLIGSIADNPDTPILECQFLDSAELDLQLNKFNHKAISIPTEETINEAFEKAVQLNKNRVAILSNHMAITYGELNERVNKLAHFIRRNGHVKPNQVACLIMDRSVELIIGI